MTSCDKQRKVDRYARYWCRISRLAKAATGGLCSYPGCECKASQTHHAAYLEKDERDRMVPIRGREVPGVHVFPLCLRHHSKQRRDGAHHPRNWKKGSTPPDYLDAVQEPEFYKKLLEGFKEKSDRVKSGQIFVKSERASQSKPKPKPVKRKTGTKPVIKP